MSWQPFRNISGGLSGCFCWALRCFWWAIRYHSLSNENDIWFQSLEMESATPIEGLWNWKKHLLLTLIQPGKGRFTLAYMSHDHLHGSHVGLPMIERGGSPLVLSIWLWHNLTSSSYFLDDITLPEQMRMCHLEIFSLRLFHISLLTLHSIGYV